MRLSPDSRRLAAARHSAVMSAGGPAAVQSAAGTLDVTGASRAGRTAYRAADPFDRVFAGRNASRRSADGNWLNERLRVLPRVRDVVRNEPLADSAVEQKVSLIVGTGWKFSSAPPPEAFGLTPDDDRYLRLTDSIEDAWRRATGDPLFRLDYEEALPFDLQLDLAVRHRIVDGESIGLFNWIEDRGDGFPFHTAIQLVHPARLANPMGRADGWGGAIQIALKDGTSYTLDAEDVRAGVATDERGRDIALHILRAHPVDIGKSAIKSMQGDWIDRYETPGRPRYFRSLRRREIGQTRGVSDLASSLRRFGAFQEATDTEARSRLINATIFASISSHLDPEYLVELFGNDADKLLEARAAFYEASGSDINANKVLRTFPGDNFDINDKVRAANAYADFFGALAVQAGAGAGVPANMMLRDFSKENFSSARTAINDAFRMAKRERIVDVLNFAQPALLCILQEAFYDGRLALPPGAPDFMERPDVYVKGTWIGPRREYVDPVKEAQGDRMQVENFQASFSDIAEERGKPLDEVIAERARDQRRFDRANVAPGSFDQIAAVRGGSE
ncbi:MAG: hypothetical protein CMF76_09235 [Maricaulis sp.]|nr:hypothetical protein [Oceanicaulis sp.]MAZ92130.1 hypothetical protein [Maricaulis sp.]